MFSRGSCREKPSSPESSEDSILIDPPFWGHLNIELYFIHVKSEKKTLARKHTSCEREHAKGLQAN